MLTRILLGVTLLSAAAWGQAHPGQKAVAQHYPHLIRAEVPLYPPLARTLNVTGIVEIQVVVEKGVVTDTQVKSVVIASQNGSPLNDEGTKKVGAFLSNPALANLKTWQFQPEDRATFVVTYTFQIEGQETSAPENPRVELDLPLFVKVIARPFKPTCEDCAAQ
jgi:hypothetical protein